MVDLSSGAALGLAELARALMLDGEQLRRSLEVPVLLWELAPTPGSTPRELRTRVAGVLHTPREGEPLVLPLRKANNKGNAFSMGVTVGRTSNNDLWLEDPSVSRFHAYFQLAPQGEAWQLVDAESRNGTWAGERRLAPASAHTLVDGETLRFGDVEVRFLQPASLLLLLEQHLRR
jgi:hypothetical protein